MPVGHSIGTGTALGISENGELKLHR
jgi:hypothetical protein